MVGSFLGNGAVDASEDPLVQRLSEAQSRAKAVSKARADIVRAKADQLEADQVGNSRLGFQVLVNLSPSVMRQIADRMEQLNERQSEAIRALIEVGLAAQEKD